MAEKTKRLVVIGGGAAGFFCAVNAARLAPHLEVIILEKSNKILSKVKVSGGGRCNVTHACFEIGDMVRKYPRGTNFLKKTFHQFFTTDTIQWFEERGVNLKTEADGRMFPETDSSQTIIDCLLREVNKYGIEIRMSSEVKSVEEDPAFRIQNPEFRSGEIGEASQLLTANKFIIELSGERQLTADYVCIACGGYPKTAMFDWLKQLGHTIEEPVPSLFTFNMPGNNITQLMGVSVPDAQVRIMGSKLNANGPLLITHWGMSGPVVLRLSAWGARELAAGNYQFTIAVNWLTGYNENSLREAMQGWRFELATQKIANRNPFGLPQRLWDYFLLQAGVSEHMRWADLPAKEQNKLIKYLCAQEFAVSGKTTFKEEFVTAGGIRLSEIDANTMQSKQVPGLFFAGEILDVDGITGGFNFQHAWTSGFIAAASIAGMSA
ncbi:NAD(P)/FAD-dependent oxidoreductase [Paraflavitalea soli]|uniref:NAD(P)/FAD-dependent oxidoreductase n=1 Tax=Paraflavitalea soli TaxID=2315862 RepID=A0A3B7MKY0_9BACT|nr:NAD(P)/FAD-dependent oxidoreductase [Paraflavitalea soli]AXY75124.1 NAD(P)/FAD-dependent oxidoreductase [Paraflavitalea soli]